VVKRLTRIVRNDFSHLSSSSAANFFELEQPLKKRKPKIIVGKIRDE